MSARYVRCHADYMLDTIIMGTIIMYTQTEAQASISFLHSGDPASKQDWPIIEIGFYKLKYLPLATNEQNYSNMHDCMC